MTLALFTIAAAAIVFVWNRQYQRVPVSIALLFWAVVAAYQAPTLFTSSVDLPGGLAYHAYPWKALQKQPAIANTGIVFTQLAPWTEAARRALRNGKPIELPLWNRDSASGSPLFANQQTAILHPFTLLGLPLTIGKAFTLSACLRLFTVLFFTFVFLKKWELRTAAAVYGAIAYAFCTFHIVWLLFPLGLATMMLPLVLAGIDELSKRQTVTAALPLVAGVAMTLLGGHPESAAWVLAASGAYALYVRFASRPLAWILFATLTGIALTAVWWYPTWRILPHTSRSAVLEVFRAAPAHRFSADWFLPLVAPNVLGTPQSGTYRAPQPANPGVLDDYGEIASGYAGAVSLGFALLALTRMRSAPRGFFAGAAVFALLTIMEVPGWRTLIAHTPLIGITLVGRLRFVFALAVALLAAIGVDDWLAARSSKIRVMICLAIGYAIVAIAYATRLSPDAHVRAIQTGHLIAAAIAVVIVIALVSRPRSWTAAVIAAVTLAELLWVTRRYNPPSPASDAYPRTGAIAFLQQQKKPFRFAAVGWSFLAETPSFYGIEDIKTTDPIASAEYVGFLNAFTRPGDYDQVLQNHRHPFLDLLSIRYVYVPSDQKTDVPWWREVYRGPDGQVLENAHALPRYYSVNDIAVAPDSEMAMRRLSAITDPRHSAIVIAVPPEVARAAPSFAAPQFFASGAEVAVARYTDNTTELRVRGSSWNLIVTSDVAWPGWRATWNGRELPIVKTNAVFVGVFVPPGEGTLRLRYQAPGLFAGALVSLFAAINLAAAWLVERRLTPSSGHVVH